MEVEPVVEGSYNGSSWVATSEAAEVVYAVSDTNDDAIGSPPPLLFFKALAAPSNRAHYVRECRNPCCSPSSPHTLTADVSPTTRGKCTISTDSCTCLQLPSRQTAAKELQATVAGRSKVTNDKTRTLQQVKRRTKPMKSIDIDPPQMGSVVAPGSTSLWEFLLELLANPIYEPYIQWRNRERGLFKIRNSEVVAALWGKHKHRTNMNFDKMARAMRYYYGKNILDKGANGGRLEYEFRAGSRWRDYKPRSIMNGIMIQHHEILHSGNNDVGKSDVGNSNVGERVRTRRHNYWLSHDA